ncbi:MAG TPA: toll/interleukin-1 receptor domain-containing protein [Bryobacteraceae bacterium]|nr:toll/interleukin-1 receptor domain-containing protein [Bryobacteraceae bacterium]
MSATPYRVFVSHGSDDRWIAGQIARRLGELGAETFLDETNIPKGANFRQIIHREIALSNEVVALFTPWSAKRSWVWIEMGAAWGQSKPVVAVFHGMGLDDLDQNGQGKGMLEDINTLKLNDIEQYLAEVATRVNGANHA